MEEEFRENGGNATLMSSSLRALETEAEEFRLLPSRLGWRFRTACRGFVKKERGYGAAVVRFRARIPAAALGRRTLSSD